MGRIYRRGEQWYADYVDRDGKRVRRNTKMKDKRTALKVLSKWENDERLVEVGLKLRTREREPLTDYLKLYTASLKTAGKGGPHIDRTSQLVEELAAYNEWKLLGHISADGVNKYANSLRTDQRQASRTIASMITACRSFCRWCVKSGHLSVDPTVTCVKPSVSTDRRIERRMLLPDEWKWLKKALEKDTFRNGQNSQERKLLYRVAIETGLRSSELRSLTKASLVLGAEPHIRARASVTKNEQDAKQYISDELTKLLQKHTVKKPPGALVFSVASRTEMAQTLRDDLEDARQLWLKTKDADESSDFLQSPNSQGEVIDFHALRHTCGAWLVMQGVTLAEVREIMRHSTITLTVDCYGHLAPDARSRSRHVLGEML